MTKDTLGLAVPADTALSEPDPAVLRNEFNEIMREVDSGKYEYQGDSNDTAAQAAHAAWVQSRVRRGIELQAILRRQNTGPARAKSATGGRGKKKPQIDTAAALKELLG